MKETNCEIQPSPLINIHSAHMIATPAEPPQLSYVDDGKWLALRDGCIVYAKTWLVESTARIVASVVFVHGLGEHIHRNEHVFSRFAQAGIQVHAYDQRGFGRTVKCVDVNRHAQQHIFGHNHGWQSVLDDVMESVQRTRIADKPLFLYGHSMGGLIALDFATTMGIQAHLAGVISSSPALGLHPSSAPSALKYYAALAVSQLIPTTVIKNQLDARAFSHCPKVVQAYTTDPYNHQYVSLRTSRDILQLGKSYRKNNYAMATTWPPQLPLLMVHGDADQICYVESTKDYYARCSAIDKSMKIYKGYMHELHNEPDIQDEYIQYLIDWIIQHSSTTTASAIATSPSLDT